MSHLTSDESKKLLEKMANSIDIQSKNINAYKLFGQGVWLLQGRSSLDLIKMDVSKAVYIPMSSLSMFFTNQSIYLEKIDPSREMLIAATHINLESKSISHIWTKVSLSIKRK